MAEKKFVNEQVIEIEAAGMKGTVTIPIIMTDGDLAKYMEEAQKAIEIVTEWKEGDEMLLKSHTTVDARKHLVRAIDFPGTSISHFREGDRPYPALTNVIMPLLEPLIDDALNLPNS